MYMYCSTSSLPPSSSASCRPTRPSIVCERWRVRATDTTTAVSAIRSTDRLICSELIFINFFEHYPVHNQPPDNWHLCALCWLVKAGLCAGCVSFFCCRLSHRTRLRLFCPLSCVEFARCARSLLTLCCKLCWHNVTYSVDIMSQIQLT